MQGGWWWETSTQLLLLVKCNETWWYLNKLSSPPPPKRFIFLCCVLKSDLISTIYGRCYWYSHILRINNRFSFIHHRNLPLGEMAPVLIKHNNLGCDCLALCWNQLTDASLKNVHISAGGIGRLIYTSSWAKLIPMKLNDCYLNGGYVQFITG